MIELKYVYFPKIAVDEWNVQINILVSVRKTNTNFNCSVVDGDMMLKDQNIFAFELKIKQIIGYMLLVQLVSHSYDAVQLSLQPEDSQFASLH